MISENVKKHFKWEQLQVIVRFPHVMREDEFYLLQQTKMPFDKHCKHILVTYIDTKTLAIAWNNLWFYRR